MAAAASAFRRAAWPLPFAAAGAAAACATGATLEEELEKIRPQAAQLREKWVEDDRAGWKKLPPRAWPVRQPTPEQIPELRQRLLAERCPAPSERGQSEVCAQTHFDLATALVFNNIDAKEGLSIYTARGQAGDTDGMTAAGVVLVEGLGVDRDDDAGLKWMRQASELDSAQAHFELGTLTYTGGAGLEEDEAAAYDLFQRAARQRHSAGMFMVADCLLEGIGCAKDQAKAVPLLLEAANMGHRGARQHLGQLLDGNWAAFIDQASRQV